MSVLDARDCSRCSAKHTVFDIVCGNRFSFTSERDEFLGHVEMFAICRNCKRASVLFAVLKSSNVAQNLLEKINSPESHRLSEFDPYAVNEMSPADLKVTACPEHTPSQVARAFTEAAKCHAIGCYNAAGAMFRLCLEAMISDKFADIKEKTLFTRLNKLINDGRLPTGTEDLLDSIRLLGNEASHDGSLIEEDANDLMEFSVLALRRVYTEPAMVAAAKLRREERKQTK